MATATDEVCKVILLGNGSVGKTSIIHRFTEDGFNRVYKQTIGLDFVEKRITLRGDTRLLLQVWDIGGQSISSTMLTKYIYGSHAVMLCFDVSDPASFADLQDWHRKVLKTMEEGASDIPGPKMPRPKIFLLGNKIDMIEADIETIKKKHTLYVKEHKLNGSYYVSAKSGDKVLSVFYQVAGEVAGIKLSEHEIAFTEKVLAATIAKSGETEELDEEARRIEAEDMALEAKKRSAEGKKCIIM